MERKSARKKHKAARARSRLEGLTFAMFDVCKATVNGVNGTGHIDTLLRACSAKGCDVIGLHEAKRVERPRFRHQDTASSSAVIAAWLPEGKGSMGLDW